MLPVSIRHVSSSPDSYHLSLGLVQNLPDLSLHLLSRAHQLVHCALMAGGCACLKVSLPLSLSL